MVVQALFALLVCVSAFITFCVVCTGTVLSSSALPWSGEDKLICALLLGGAAAALVVACFLIFLQRRRRP